MTVRCRTAPTARRAITGGSTSRSSSLRSDAINAAPRARDDVLVALDRDAFAQSLAEQRQLRAAEALAGFRGHADRAVILDQQQGALRPGTDACHIAFLAADLGEALHPLLQ